MKLLSRTEFADIYLFEEGEKCIVKKYRLKVGDEAHFLRLLHGIYTPKLYRSDSDSITIEYIDGVELNTHLLSLGQQSFAKRLELIQSIAYIYSFFHDNGVLHMDPKPDNILIRKDGTIKIIDFQLSTSIENPVVHLSHEGIPYYWYNSRPPESFRREFKPSIKSEVYTLGHLFYFILRGHFLFEDFLDRTQAELTREKLREFHDHIDRVEMPGEPLLQLIGKMISRDERERPESVEKIVHLLKGIALSPGRQQDYS